MNSGFIFIRMQERDRRALSQAASMTQLRAQLEQIPGVQAYVVLPTLIGGQRSEQLQFGIVGPDILKIDSLSDQMVARLGQIAGIAKLDKDLKLNQPEVRLVVDRERASQLGITSQDIAQMLTIMTGGLDIAEFKDNNQRYKIRMQIEASARSSIENLQRLQLKNKNGDLVRLDSLVKFEEGVGPAVITRRNRQYAGFIYASLEGLPLGNATDAVKNIAADILPAGYKIAFTGQAEEFAKTGGYVMFAFGMALIMIYMVLASQFNSLVQPLVVMIAQPLAIIGGVAALYLFGETLNLFSMSNIMPIMENRFRVSPNKYKAATPPMIAKGCAIMTTSGCTRELNWLASTM